MNRAIDKESEKRAADQAWADSPAIRDEFVGNKAAFVAYRLAEAEGRCGAIGRAGGTAEPLANTGSDIKGEGDGGTTPEKPAAAPGPAAPAEAPPEPHPLQAKWRAENLARARQRRIETGFDD